MKRWMGFMVVALLLIFFGSCSKNDENKDSTPPFIVVLGSDPVYTELDSAYVDAGAKAYDVQENGDTLDISDRLQVTDDVDIHKRGMYKVYFNVSDAAGNKAEEKTRTVIVEIF